jgi:hypothetical protein
MKFKIKESQLRRLIKSTINEVITNVKDPSMYYSDSDDTSSYLNCNKESNLHNIIKESIRKSLNESNDTQELCYQFKKWLEYNYYGMRALGEYVYSNELSPQYVIDEFVDYHPEYGDILDGNGYNQLERIVDICAREYMDEDDADTYNSSIEGNFN